MTITKETEECMWHQYTLLSMTELAMTIHAETPYKSKN